MNVPRISAPLLRFFRRIVRGYFRRNFHAVRISAAERLADLDGPLIIYANHSSWWDPMVSIFLAHTKLSGRQHYAPMDAQALDRYPILKRLGIFPVQLNTLRGAAQFLRVGELILQKGGVLWVTPQGRFVDNRQRPLEFKPGLATLVRRLVEHSGSCTLIPLAIEYPFWNERLPEALLHVGTAVKFVSPDASTSDIQVQLVQALETAMEELRGLALTRDASKFKALLGGRAGTGGFYALGQRIKALIQRRPYNPEHSAQPLLSKMNQADMGK
jgi:1-acyl-sn-glycerol-3-phosphate acyltransferase